MSPRVMLMIVLLIGPSFPMSFGLAPPPLPPPRGRTSENGWDDSTFMESLSERIRKANQLPLIFRETLLPRQVLKITIKNGLFLDLIRKRIEDETPYFGMLGIQQSGDLMNRGVEVMLLKWEMNPWKTGVRLELKATRRFEIAGYVGENRLGGWHQAAVQYLNTTNEEGEKSIENARLQARELTELSQRWIELARKHERFADQIDLLLNDLKDIPSWYDEPSECAFWVGALINPTPKIHLAYEIRQKLLNAQTAEERTSVTLEALKTSLCRMDPSFRTKTSNSTDTSSLTEGKIEN